MPKEEPEIVGNITDIEIIAVNASIRVLAELKKAFGGDRWRKLKGVAHVIRDGKVVLAEVHWYECVRREVVGQFTGKSSSGRELSH